MYNLIALAQVLLVFTIIGAVSVYVLSIMSGLNLSNQAQAFITQGFGYYTILGQFGQVIVVVAVVGILVGLLGVRLGQAG